MTKLFQKGPFTILKSTTFLTILVTLLISCKPKPNLPDPLEASWNNQMVCENLEENDELRVLKCTFPPGVGHERHYHNAHFGYALAGSTFRMKDTTGVREVKVSSGTNYYNPGIQWHEALNIGDSTAVFLIIEPK